MIFKKLIFSFIFFFFIISCSKITTYPDYVINQSFNPPTNNNSNIVYPGDHGINYGDVIEVVTPLVYVDGVWGTSFLIREKDTNRMNYIWKCILKSFNSDNKGLSFIFGYTNDMPNNLKKVKPSDRRFYQNFNNDTDFDLYQGFDFTNDFIYYKNPVTNGTKINEFQNAVIVKIENDDFYRGTDWVGKYTIGGSYKVLFNIMINKTWSKLPPTNDSVIYVIRMDLSKTNYNNSDIYYRIQTLFDKRKNGRGWDYPGDLKVYNSYYDFSIFGCRFSDNLWAVGYAKSTFFNGK